MDKRHTLRNQGFGNLTAVSSELVGPNTKRIGLIVSAPAVNAVTLSFLGPAVARQGITLAPGGNPLVLTHELIGDAITDAIQAVTAVGNETIGFVEFLR